MLPIKYCELDLRSDRFRRDLLPGLGIDPIQENGAHRLRNTFCSHLAMLNAPVKATQELAGHKDLSTTQIRLLDSRQSKGGRGDERESGSTETANSSQ